MRILTACTMSPLFSLPPATFSLPTCRHHAGMKQYTWRGFRQTKGLRSKTKRVISQFSPADWTTFKWEGTTDFTHYFSVLMLLAVFLAAELNPFYLKAGHLSSLSILSRLIHLVLGLHPFWLYRRYCGWNQTIHLLLQDWLVSSCAPCLL